MFLKFIAAVAVMAAPAVAHAQATTPTYPQDTTRSSSRIHTDSTRVDSSNGSVTTTDSTRKTKDRIRDTTTAGKTKTRSDSTRWHSDSTMNAKPIDSTRMSTPPTNSTRTPPR
jgi:Ni/Co efflux regulator RcnB